MTKYEIDRFADSEAERIRPIEITRETVSSYWTPRKPDRWSKATEQIHRRDSSPIYDTEEEAKAEWVSLCRRRVAMTKSYLEDAKRSVDRAEEALKIAEAHHA